MIAQAENEMNLFGLKIPDSLFHEETKENEPNLLGLKIPDALFHAESKEKEPNVVGLSMPDWLFHEPATAESDREPSRTPQLLPLPSQQVTLWLLRLIIISPSLVLACMQFSAGAYPRSCRMLVS